MDAQSATIVSTSKYSGYSEDLLSASRIFENQLFQFVSSLQYRPKQRIWHRVGYVVLEVYLMLQTLSLMISSKFPWSSMDKGYYGVETIRNFGLQYAPFDFFKYFIGVILGLQLILCTCVIIEYRSYSKGSATWLFGRKLRKVIRLLSCLSLLLSFPIIFGLTSYVDCDYKKAELRRFSKRKCWTTEVSIWGAIGIAGVFVQILTSSLGVIIYCDLSPSGSFFSMVDNYSVVLGLAVSQFTLLLTEVLPVKVLAVSPAVFTLGSLAQLIIVIRYLPYFRTTANSVKAGYCTSKITIGILGFIFTIVNLKEKKPIAIAFSVVTLASPLIVFVITTVVTEVVIRFGIISYVRRVADQMSEECAPEPNMILMEMGIRLLITGGKDDRLVHKLYLDMAAHKIESYLLLHNQAMYLVYYKREQLEYACHLIRKSYKYKPGIIMRYSNIQRIAGIEQEFHETINLDALRKEINNAKKKQSMTISFFRDFWKLYLGDTVTVASVSKIIQQSEQCVKDCNRIFNAMLLKYPKSHQAYRAYANYVEEIVNDTESAEVLYAEADEMEEEEMKAKRKKLTKHVDSGSNSFQLLSARFSGRRASNNQVVPSTATESPIDLPAVDQESSCSQDERLKRLNQLRKSISKEDPEYEDFETLSMSDGDFNHAREEAKRKELNMHKSIMKKDGKYVIRAIILSIIPFFMAVIVGMVIFIAKALHKHDSLKLYRGCRASVLSYQTLAQFRHMQRNGTFSNDQLDVFRSEMKLEIQELKEFKKSAMHIPKTYSEASVLWSSTRFELLIPFITTNGSTSYTAANYSLYDVVGMLKANTEELLNQDIHEMNSTTTNTAFWYLWMNRERNDEYFTEFCQAYLDDFRRSDMDTDRSFEWVFPLIAGIAIIYLVCYIPLLVVLLRSRVFIVNLFHSVPKEVVGRIYQKLTKSVVEEYSYNSWTIPSMYQILACLFLLLVAEALCVSLLIFSGVSAVKSDMGSSELITVAASLTRHTSKYNFLLNEYYSNELIPQSEEFRSTVMQEMKLMRRHYNSVRFGSDLKSKKSILGKSKKIDAQVLLYTCTTYDDYRCYSLDNLIDHIDREGSRFLNEIAASDDELNRERSDNLFRYSRRAEIVLDDVMTRYVKYSGSQANMKINIYWLVGVYIPILLFIGIPFFVALDNYINENHQIRQLLHWVPIDTIDSVRRLKSYALTFSARRTSARKTKDQDSQALAIIDSAADGVVMSTEVGTINMFNKAAQVMFGYDTTDVIGQNFSFLFPDKDAIEIRKLLADMLRRKKSSAAVHEFSGKRKNGNLFPLRVCVSISEFEKKKTIAAFCRDLTAEKKQQDLLNIEKKNSEELLLNILPAPVASRLKNGETMIAEEFNDVTVLFSDIVGFTAMSSTMKAGDLVAMLNSLIYRFDQQVVNLGVEKVKTIGDAYFAVGGLHQSQTDHPEKMVLLAMGMLSTIKDYNSETNSNIQMRIGLHTGPVSTGVIGMTKFTYDLYGDTVNMASRMESTSLPNRVQLSRDTYERVHDLFECEERQHVEVKGKGIVNTYMLIGPKNSSTQILQQIGQSFRAQNVPTFMRSSFKELKKELGKVSGAPETCSAADKYKVLESESDHDYNESVMYPNSRQTSPSPNEAEHLLKEKISQLAN